MKEDLLQRLKRGEVISLIFPVRRPIYIISYRYTISCASYVSERRSSGRTYGWTDGRNNVRKEMLGVYKNVRCFLMTNVASSYVKSGEQGS